jgi:hypothetical protein
MPIGVLPFAFVARPVQLREPNDIAAPFGATILAVPREKGGLLGGPCAFEIAADALFAAKGLAVDIGEKLTVALCFGFAGHLQSLCSIEIQ